MKILLVEDDTHVAWVLQTMLETLGHVCTPCQSAEEGLVYLLNHPKAFDCMLLDRNMPGMSGIGLLKAIRQSEPLKELPVIMLTGSAQVSEVAEGLAHGAQLYLAKPASLDLLRAALETVKRQHLQKEDLNKQLNCTQHGLRMASTLNFQFQTVLQAEQLAGTLAHLAEEPDAVVLGLAELLINAVEHGNLNIGYAEKSRLLENNQLAQEVERRLSMPHYSERLVRVQVVRMGTYFQITIQDEGKGFDWRPYMTFSSDRAFDLHGRGIALANSAVFHSLRYLGQGNIVQVYLGPSRESEGITLESLDHHVAAPTQNMHSKY